MKGRNVELERDGKGREASSSQARSGALARKHTAPSTVWRTAGLLP